MALPFLMEVEMKIEDMIMVVENRKGIETNMLCTMAEFVVNFVLGGEKQQIQILEESMKLRDTKHSTEWYEEYYSAVRHAGVCPCPHRCWCEAKGMGFGRSCA